MNRICKLLDIKYPCIQGGMAWIADGRLAAAAANAGVAGLVAAGAAPADIVREQIRRARELTNNTFGVNIMLMSPHSADIAQLVIDEKVALVTTGAGSPSPYMAAWKEAGIKILPVIASVAQAKKMERLGADAVIAEGMEAGGHIGQTTTMALTPQVTSAVDIPVLAAGGIADGRGIAAAFMLGAEGVQIGTRFIATTECGAHENYKQCLLDAKDSGTTVTGQIAGSAAARLIKNSFARGIIEKERSGITPEELEHLLSGSLRRAAMDGDLKNGSVMAGQCAGMINDVKSIAQVVEEMFYQAKDLLSKGAEL